ncbi:MAG TPA: acetolactate synthase small subunit [Candidatus Dadabacteria bacterium]|nr:acetolactate synthase small subunit [Candidatus Dadabacteria bacterium]
MRHILSILVDNEPGVLARIAGLFTARGFNIESLCVAETERPSLSKITLVTSGEDWVIDQIIKRFENMINVIKVRDFSDADSIQRELIIARVVPTKNSRSEVLRVADIFRSNVVDVGPKSYTLELTGNKEKLEAFVAILRPLGLKEVTRTGLISLPREKKMKEI